VGAKIQVLKNKDKRNSSELFRKMAVDVLSQFMQNMIAWKLYFVYSRLMEPLQEIIKKKTWSDPTSTT